MCDRRPTPAVVIGGASSARAGRLRSNPCIQRGESTVEGILKFFGSVVGIIFLIGLLVVIGLLALIF